MAKGLGLAKHSYSRQDPGRNTQLQSPWVSQGFANPGAPFPVPLAQSLFPRFR